MTAKEWLQRTLPERIEGMSEYYRHNRPRARCADGFTVSIQANTDGHYCQPRDTNYDGTPWAVELGYPSEADDRLMEYAEDKDRPTNTVYGYVPLDVVEAVVADHGGIVEAMSNGMALSKEIEWIAGQLGPPKPAPGTVVWWRFFYEDESEADDEWHIGIIAEGPNTIHTKGFSVSFDEIEWKPATILQPGQVPVDVPDVDEWPGEFDAIVWDFGSSEEDDYINLITRSEAQEMLR